MSFNKLNVNELRNICKEYKIPLSGCKNKKDILHQILIRRSMFKPVLPKEIYKSILLFVDHNNLLKCRLCCKQFNEIVDNNFWREKIHIQFNIIPKDTLNSYYEMEYIKIATKRGLIMRGSELTLSIKDCINKAWKEGGGDLVEYFYRVAETHGLLNHLSDSDEDPYGCF